MGWVQWLSAPMVFGSLLTYTPLFVDLPHDRAYIESIIYVSLYVSLIAVFLSTIVSLAIAFLVGFSDFRGKAFVVAIINTGMGFPSVVVGLVVLLAVSHQGPLGPLNLVFTREAMILSQFVLATPVITGVSLAAVTSVDVGVRDAAYVLGGNRLDVTLLTIKEARYGILAGILAGLGRAISEVGSVLIVGGNIVTDGTSVTRTLTTAIQHEARQGRIETALVLGTILMALVLLINGVLLRFGGGGRY